MNSRTKPASPRHILLVDDDGHIREVVRFALEQAGYRVTEAANGRSALESFERGSFDLVVLDIIMPELDGLEVCKEIRKASRLPLIFLSSRDEELDRILGLELGADDYVTKPFSPRELVARVKAALRRFDDVQELLREASRSKAISARECENASVLSHGPLSLDPVRHECSLNDKQLVFTVSEFGLLQALLTRPDHVQSRQQLVEQAYGHGHFLSDRTVDSHIRRIRNKLRQAGYECIETVYGVGYRLREPD